MVFGESPYYSFELTNLSRVAFQVADDPFYKVLKGKFYPEVLVMNLKGEVKARVNAQTPLYLKNGQTALSFEDDIREPKLKVNDDRRVHINLSALLSKSGKGTSSLGDIRDGSQLSKGSHAGASVSKGKMILLTVKVAESMRGKQDFGEYERAWYRLVNVDTSQTLEYKKLKEINGPDAATNATEEVAGEENEEAGAPKATESYLTYLAGRIYLDSKEGRWVYESFNHLLSSDRGDLGEVLGHMYSRAEN